MISHVVFDFDGTLADSLQFYIGLYNELAEQHRYGKLTPENLAELRRLPILERCNRLGVPAYRLPWLVVQLSRRSRQVAQDIGFNAGIPELLQQLRARGLTLAILSTNTEENIRVFLQRHGAGDWVEAIHCSSRLFGKARLLRELMRRSRLRPEQLVYVGDEHRDIEACKEAGVRVIAVSWGADALARLREAGPDHLAEHPADIADCVSRWLALAP